MVVSPAYLASMEVGNPLRNWNRLVDGSPYSALGVKERASFREVRKGYRLLARKYHPDLNPGDTKKENERKFDTVTRAYKFLEAVLRDQQEVRTSVKRKRDHFDDDTGEEQRVKERKAEALRRMKEAEEARLENERREKEAEAIRKAEEARIRAEEARLQAERVYKQKLIKKENKLSGDLKNIRLELLGALRDVEVRRQAEESAMKRTGSDTQLEQLLLRSAELKKDRLRIKETEIVLELQDVREKIKEFEDKFARPTGMEED
jgi:curved DNA-binding protein CbpA